MNPILVHNMVLGYLFNLYKGKPLVREGGVIIATHPVPDEWDDVYHPSYRPYFDEVIAATTDPHEGERRFQDKYALDPWYRTLYRSAHAYHGFHPFTTWQWGAHALDHLGGVVFVGGDPHTTSRMGYKRADTIAEGPAGCGAHSRGQPEHHVHAHPAAVYGRGELDGGGSGPNESPVYEMGHDGYGVRREAEAQVPLVAEALDPAGCCVRQERPSGTFAVLPSRCARRAPLDPLRMPEVAQDLAGRRLVLRGPAAPPPTADDHDAPVGRRRFNNASATARR
jgi:hypothetical protein